MKKLIIIIIILGIGFGIFKYNNGFIEDKLVSLKEKRININDEATIDEVYIYGRSLNLKGTLEIENKDIQDLKLALYYNNKFNYFNLSYESDVNKINFWITDKINKGIIIDNINLGKYYMFIEASYKSNEEITKEYYSLKNETSYLETTYYTFASINHKITITNEDSYPTMMLRVEEYKCQYKNAQKREYNYVQLWE